MIVDKNERILLVGIRIGRRMLTEHRVVHDRITPDGIYFYCLLLVLDDII